jgi:hypothetical protein
MEISLTGEFRQLCSEIVAQGRTADEWGAVESSDMFQTTNYVGGFDATEMEFTFSYYDAEGREFWFQVPLEDVSEIADGRKTTVRGRPAEK